MKKVEKIDKEQVWKQAWRPAAAYLYLAICFADFIGFPVYYMALARVNDAAVVEQALKFKDGTAQVEVLKTLRHEQTWTPITTVGGGMIHIALGSIIGVSAWTRGQEKIELVKQGPGTEGGEPPQNS
jgi:hypothetical protein